jgi:hypothetical protein
MEINEQLAAVLRERYKDGYLNSRAIVGFGSSIKSVGAVLGILIFFASFLQKNTITIIFSVIAAMLVAIILYFLGVNISAQGQILQATLDSAVNSSPFLDSEQKIEMMCLPMALLETRQEAQRIINRENASEIEKQTVVDKKNVILGICEICGKNATTMNRLAGINRCSGHPI